MKRNTVTIWIEAMRLRTLSVSLAGVFMALGLALHDDCFKAAPVVLCFVFALLAQIASNFANEYYDYRDGLDAPGREGPRRGVTEGDITPGAMLKATYLTLALACAVGCGLIAYGGWWLLPAGIFIALGAMAYSTGPYPLSRHGLGEVAVILFFGIIPVTLTYYVQAHQVTADVWIASLSTGLLGANVIIVNNYRDADADKAVGKRTLAVIFGRRAMPWLYLVNGLVAIGIMIPQWMAMTDAVFAVPAITLTLVVAIRTAMPHRSGHALTPLLGMTSLTMLFYCAGFAVTAFLD